jgi:hypothetical protein
VCVVQAYTQREREKRGEKEATTTDKSEKKRRKGRKRSIIIHSK